MRVLPLRILNYPKHAQIEITNLCNLKCKMCAHTTESWKGKTQPKFLKMEEFKYIINQLRFLRLATLSGVGEPLLNPNLTDMIQYCHNKGIISSFFTNATMLTPEKSKELLSVNGLEMIFVSMDTGDAKKYEQIRQGANFLEICSNIDCFIKLRKERKCIKPNVSFFMVAMKENVHDIPLLVDLMENIGIGHLNIKNMMIAEDIEGTPITRHDLPFLANVQRDAAKRNIIVTYHQMPENNINKTETRTCLGPWTTTYINVSGIVNPCCYSFPFESAAFGNIFDTPFRNIWNNRYYQNFRKELKKGLPDICINCPGHSLKIMNPTT